MFNRVLFIGSKTSGFKVLKAMYETSPDVLIGCVTVDDSTDTRSELNSFKEFCKNNNIPIKILTGKCDLRDTVSFYNPELCIVMGWYFLIPNDVLNSVKGGFVGVHYSLLPSYRGFAPVVWSILAGEKECGFSVFSISAGMDTGDIWYQSKVRIEESDYIADVLNKLDEGVIQFFNNHYNDLISGSLFPVAQKKEGISYGALRRPEDGRIDWNLPAIEVYNFIRAQSNPYPGAFSTYKGTVLTIWKSEVFPHPIHGTPGQIFLFDDSVVIICGKSTGLIIDEIEIANKLLRARNYIKDLKYKML